MHSSILTLRHSTRRSEAQNSGPRGRESILSPLFETPIPDPVHSGEELRFVKIGSARGSPLRWSGESMNQGQKVMHHEAYKAGTNVIFLEPVSTDQPA